MLSESDFKLRAGSAFTAAAIIMALSLITVFFASCSNDEQTSEMSYKKKVRKHHNHSAYFTKQFDSPQDVTKACLTCHEDSADEIMKTSHWTWLGEKVAPKEGAEPIRIGKKNLINNFCIGIQGNWPSCTKCHAGYGWSDENFDFDEESNVDCLVCHDRSGTYAKGPSGMPKKGVDLLVSAKSVDVPGRTNCGSCHDFGGGGEAVKHGDLDASLDNPDKNIDVHMGGQNMLCIDCHGGRGHDIRGKAISVSVDPDFEIGCAKCHNEKPHEDQRLNDHTSAVACQTCHIPLYALKVPTKMHWDWSKAGRDDIPDDPHKYLKIKGEFIYDQEVVPEYYWFNKSADRYVLGDPINPDGPTDINNPRGDINDKTAKIHPFKVHRATQPYDKKNKYLIPPVTAGEGGFWHEFNWDKAMRLGAKTVGLEYSGEYGFTETEMYWPLAHMVAPSEKALKCEACHGDNSRMDWKALGYGSDPIKTGGRK